MLARNCCCYPPSYLLSPDHDLLIQSLCLSVASSTSWSFLLGRALPQPSFQAARSGFLPSSNSVAIRSQDMLPSYIRLFPLLGGYRKTLLRKGCVRVCLCVHACMLVICSCVPPVCVYINMCERCLDLAHCHSHFLKSKFILENAKESIVTMRWKWGAGRVDCNVGWEPLVRKKMFWLSPWFHEHIYLSKTHEILILMTWMLFGH